MKQKRKPAWDLVSALSLIRELQPWAFKAGFNLHLGGGVLDRGYSENDLDILAMPRCQVKDHDEEAVIDNVRGFHRESVEHSFPHRRVVTFTCGTLMPPWELIFVRL